VSPSAASHPTGVIPAGPVRDNPVSENSDNANPPRPGEPGRVLENRANQVRCEWAFSVLSGIGFAAGFLDPPGAGHFRVGSTFAAC